MLETRALEATLTLRRWMNESKTTPTQMIALLQISRQHVYFLMTRKRSPSVWLAKRIIELSKGAVRAQDLKEIK